MIINKIEICLTHEARKKNWIYYIFINNILLNQQIYYIIKILYFWKKWFARALSIKPKSKLNTIWIWDQIIMRLKTFQCFRNQSQTYLHCCWVCLVWPRIRDPCYRVFRPALNIVNASAVGWTITGSLVYNGSKNKMGHPALGLTPTPPDSLENNGIITLGVFWLARCQILSDVVGCSPEIVKYCKIATNILLPSSVLVPALLDWVSLNITCLPTPTSPTP